MHGIFWGLLPVIQEHLHPLEKRLTEWLKDAGDEHN